MSLTVEQVHKVAGLARLSLSDNEIAKQTVHLNALLEQFDKLNELDVSGIEPTAHSVPIFNALREDVALPSLPREAALANAPEARDGCFIVPRILEG